MRRPVRQSPTSVRGTAAPRPLADRALAARRQPDVTVVHQPVRAKRPPRPQRWAAPSPQTAPGRLA